MWKPFLFEFRFKRGCYDALKQIKYYWKKVIWTINIDLQKYFDKVNHVVLFTILSEYCGQATIEFIWKLLKVGCVDIYNLNDRSEYKSEGTFSLYQ